MSDLPQCSHPKCDKQVKDYRRKFCSPKCYRRYQHEYRDTGWHKTNEAAYHNKHRQFGNNKELKKLYSNVDLKLKIEYNDDELLSRIR